MATKGSFWELFRVGSAWLTYDYNAMSVQLELQLPTGTELRNIRAIYGQVSDNISTCMDNGWTRFSNFLYYKSLSHNVWHPSFGFAQFLQLGLLHNDETIFIKYLCYIWTIFGVKIIVPTLGVKMFVPRPCVWKMFFPRGETNRLSIGDKEKV